MRVSPIIGRAGGAKTYAEFQAHIAALAPNSQPYSGSVASFSGACRITTSPTMPGYAPLTGSPWGPLSADGVSGSYSYWPRIIQHAMPDEAAWNVVTAVGGEVFLSVEDGGIASPVYAAYTRNGFTSSASGSSSTYRRYITEMLLYIPGQGPIQMKPKLGLGPTPFTW